MVLALASLVGFLLPGRAISAGYSLGFDTEALLAIYAASPAGLETLGAARFATHLCRVTLSIVLLSVYIFYTRGHKISAGLFSISAFAEPVLVHPLKDLHARSRPELFTSGYTEPYFSFPSGPAVIATSFFGTFSLLATYHSSGWKRRALTGLGLVIVDLTGFSRLYLGAHYPTDVLRGYRVGTLWASALICESCGVISEFDECPLDPSRLPAETSDFEVRSHSLEVYSQCAGCAWRIRTFAT